MFLIEFMIQFFKNPLAYAVPLSTLHQILLTKKTKKKTKKSKKRKPTPDSVENNSKDKKE